MSEQRAAAFSEHKMILLVGYYGFGNIGDEAILSAIVAQFHLKRPGARIVVVSGNPPETAAAHGVEAVAWNDMTAIHHAVQACDLVVVGGGGLFHDYWGVDPDTFLSDAHWGVAYHAGPALLGALHGKRVMLYAVGVGPLLSEHGTHITRLAAEVAHLITVRDDGSKSILIGMGVPAAKIHVTADPAFVFERAECAPGESVQTRRPILGIAARRWNIGVDAAFLERELANTADRFVEQTGGTVLFIPFQSLAGEAEDDRATSGRIKAAMRFQEKAAVTSGQFTPDRIFRLIESCDLVLGMRLHALIFAAMTGVPAVAISYDAKVDELARQLALMFVVDVKAVTSFSLAPRLLEALRRGGEFRDAMKLAVSRRKDLAGTNVSHALALLDAPATRSPLSPEYFDLLARALFRGSREEQHAKQLAVTINSNASSFATDRDWLRDELADVAGQLAQAVRELAEARHDGLKLAEDNRSLAEQLAVEARVTAETAARATEQLAAEARVTAETKARAAELDANLELESKQRREAEHLRDEFAARLRQADEARAFVQGEMDLYTSRLGDEFAVYRSQRAWKAMLVCRKAYALFAQSKAQFMGWAAALPFTGPGPLNEFELTFPNLENYIPAGFRRSWLDLELPLAAQAQAREPDEIPLAKGRPQKDRVDIVVLAIIDFDFRFQRPQQLAAEFARRGHRVFWISPTRFLAPDSPEPYKVAPLRDGLWEIQLRSRQPDIYLGELKPGDVDSMAEALRHLYLDWGIGENAIFVQLPFWRRLALQLRAPHGSVLLYDCMDDWETFENMGRFNVSEEKQLVRECDVLIVTGAELERKFREQGLKPALARNGADFEFFSKAGPNNLLDGISKPIVGYFGAIADWIDLDLVHEVARCRPQYSFVLIGQVFGRDVSKLESLPNVRLLGNRPYADIPSYLHCFDACIIPFLINQVTKATDPVKLYEYFSLGKPVVATAMQELNQCGDLVYIGRDTREFIEKLDAAVAETDAGLSRRRIDFARANTWADRADHIHRLINEAVPLVSILIVTHNSGAFARPCLDSIRRNTSYPSYEVILADNASTDETPELLREFARYDDRFRLTCLTENLGFAGGNNYAAAQARGEYLIFLNADTMVTSGWIERLLRHVRINPSIGLICPVTNFAGNEVKINVNYTGWRDMERFARELARQQNGRRIEIAVAPLYCALMPRAVWKLVGEIDTRYEIGMFEDDDLTLRVRQAGFGVYAAEDCFVHHFGQGSFSKLPPETYNRIFEANRKRFEEKWKQEWVGHQTRPGVRPAHEESRFDPVEFTRDPVV